VGGALTRIGNVVMKPYDRAAALYFRTLLPALAAPGLVLGSAPRMFAAWPWRWCRRSAPT
jgi:hypothetical protein